MWFIHATTQTVFLLCYIQKQKNKKLQNKTTHLLTYIWTLSQQDCLGLTVAPPRTSNTWSSHCWWLLQFAAVVKTQNSTKNFLLHHFVLKLKKWNKIFNTHNGILWMLSTLMPFVVYMPNAKVTVDWWTGWLRLAHTKTRTVANKLKTPNMII